MSVLSTFGRTRTSSSRCASDIVLYERTARVRAVLSRRSRIDIQASCVAVAGASRFAARQHATLSMSTADPHPPVVIIGAGLAGLSAASRLYVNGVPFVILEATERIGGRVYTRPGTHHDLGATWFHGTEENSAFDVALAAGLTMKADDFESDHSWPAPQTLTNAEHDANVHHSSTCEEPVINNDSHVENVDDDVDSNSHFEPDIGVLVMCSIDAAVVGESGVCRRISKYEILPTVMKYANILKQLEMDAVSDNIASNVSMYDYVRARFSKEMTTLEKAIFRSRDQLECTINGCNDSTREQSALRNHDYVELHGNHVMPKDGMTSLVNAIASTVPEECIRTDCEVKAIHWTEHHPRVILSTGEELTASCIIWTPSVNVMKAWTENAADAGQFQPALPEQKLHALDETGQGIVAKVIVTLERTLSNVESDHAMAVLWEGIEKCERWQHGIFSLSYDGELRIITFWLSGTVAIEFEELSDEAAATETASVLSLLYAQPVEVKAVHRSKWGTNRHFRGAYTFPKTGSSEGRTKELAAPLPSNATPHLCFAGEATHDRFYSTMHGAVESGRREADRCAEYLIRCKTVSGTA